MGGWRASDGLNEVQQEVNKNSNEHDGGFCPCHLIILILFFRYAGSNLKIPVRVFPVFDFQDMDDQDIIMN